MDRASFIIQDYEYALGTKWILEVVSAAKLKPKRSLSSEHIVGEILFRESYVPVVDLYSLLGIPASPKSEEELNSQVVTVLECQGVQFGLLFEKTGALGKELDHELKAQTLEPMEILSKLNIPKDQAITKSIKKDVLKRDLQAVVFKIGQKHYAMGMKSVKEIVPALDIDRNAFVGGACLGSLRVRERFYPLIDFGLALGRDESSDAPLEKRKALILEVSDDPKDGEVAFLVDEVKELLAFSSKELRALDSADQSLPAQASLPLSKDVGTGAPYLIPDLIFRDQKIRMIASSHFSVFSGQSAMENHMKEKSAKDAMKTYITFSMGQEFALEIDQIQEVLDTEKGALLQASSSERINVRGEEISLVNPASIFTELRPESAAFSKALIIEIQNQKRAILVESVNEILSFNDKFTKLPKTLFKPANSKAGANAIKEVLMRKDRYGRDKMLMLLKPEALVA